MRADTKRLLGTVTEFCAELDEMRATVESGPPETAELVKLRDRLRDHDQMVDHYHTEMRVRRLADTALEMAAIDAYYRLSDAQQDKLKQHEGHEPWYEIQRQWRFAAQDRIDQEYA